MIFSIKCVYAMCLSCFILPWKLFYATENKYIMFEGEIKERNGDQNDLNKFSTKLHLEF